MKLVAVFLFALLVGALGYNWFPENLECVEEQNLNKIEIETLDDPWNKPSPEDNKVLNNFLECTWKKRGTLNDNGEINWDKLHDRTDDNLKKGESTSDSGDIVAYIVSGRLFHISINRCREEKIHGSSPGETVAKVQNCLGVKLRQYYFS